MSWGSSLIHFKCTSIEQSFKQIGLITHVHADEDEPLFLSLIEDLFPSVSHERGGHAQLMDAIAEVTEEMGLINHPPWRLKLIQVSQDLIIFFVMNLSFTFT